MNFFDKNRNARLIFTLPLGLLGGVITFAPLYFGMSYYFVVGGFIIGMVLMGASGLITQSSTLDFRAFTNDPLGWRKAKESYKPTSPKSSPDDEAPKP